MYLGGGGAVDGSAGGARTPPQQADGDPQGLGRAVDLMRARKTAAQLYVLRDGQVLVDQAVGCGSDALFWTFSASKPYVALLVHLLAERGALALDDPVARYW